MKLNYSTHFKIGMVLAISAAMLLSCNEKDIYVDAPYPEQLIGISQAAVATVGPGANGVFRVAGNLVGKEKKFVIDAPGNKFNIPMGIIRSGINLNGTIETSIAAASNDTIAKLRASGLIIPSTTEFLPTSAYSIPSFVVIENGKPTGEFNLTVDYNFLVTNITKKYAVAIGLSTAKSELVNPKLSVAVIYIDPAVVLLPTATFGVAVDAGTKTVEFLNSSLNGASYSWSFGDGSAIDNTLFPKHKYDAAGTYPVTLTVTGVTGATATRTTNVTIL